MHILEFLEMVIFEINFTTPVILKVLIKDIPMKLSVFQVLLSLYIINCFSRPNASTEIDTYENNSVWFFLDHPVIIFRYSIILWLWYCTIKLILSSIALVRVGFFTFFEWQNPRGEVLCPDWQTISLLR